MTHSEKELFAKLAKPSFNEMTEIYYGWITSFPASEPDFILKRRELFKDHGWTIDEFINKGVELDLLPHD